MDFVKQFLADQTGPLVNQLSSQLGFNADQARSFVPAAVERVMSALQGGGLDLGSLLSGGGGEEIVSKIDTAELANQAGVDQTTATAGLQALLPSVLGSLQEQGGGAAGVLKLLGGGQASGLLGKLGGLFK